MISGKCDIWDLDTMHDENSNLNTENRDGNRSKKQKCEKHDQKNSQGPWPHLREFFTFQSYNKELGKLSFKCVLCISQKNISVNVSSNANLRSHIKHIHPTKLDDFNNTTKNGAERVLKRKSTQDVSDKPKLKQNKLNNFGQSPLTKKEFNQLTIKLIINTASPFSFVDHEAFVEFCTRAAQQKPMCRQTLTNKVCTNFQQMKKDLIEELKNVKWVCVTADCWTAFKKSYLGMTVHWLDSDLNRKSKGLACRRIKGSHTYDVLASAIETVLNEFEIQTITTCIVTDNARNFEKAFRVFSDMSEIETEKSESANAIEIEKHLEIADILAENEETFSFRLPPQRKCASHTINLISTTDASSAETNASYKAISRRTFSKCQALFNKQNQSNVTADLIQEKFGKYFTVPNATRWNSFYDAIKGITANIEQVNNLLPSLSLPVFTPIEIDFLREYCSAMESIATGLDILQGDNHIYLGYLLPTLISIEDLLNKKLSRAVYTKPLINALLKGIQQRFHHLYNDNDYDWQLVYYRSLN